MRACRPHPTHTPLPPAPDTLQVVSRPCASVVKEACKEEPRADPGLYLQQRR